MHKRFLYGKIVIAQIAAFALTIFISSNFLFNETTVTNANAVVAGVQIDNGSGTSRVVTNRFAGRTVRRMATPTSEPTSKPTSIPTAVPTARATPTATPTNTPTNNTQSNLSGLESQTVVLINDERKRQGLSELGTDNALVTAARRHAKDMCDHNNFSHTGTDGSNFSIRTKDAGYGGFASGEVIGWNHTSADTIFHGWMQSPPHHDIIMGSGINKIGIGWSGNCVVGVVGS